MADAFDSEARVFKIEEKSSLETGDIEVTEHLSEVSVVEGGDDFWIYDHQTLHDEVGDEFADELPLVADFEGALTFALFRSSSTWAFS